MNIQRKSILLVFLILLIPSTLFAGYKLNTGYDLYHNIKLKDNPQNSDDIVVGIYTTGFLAGYLDGLSLTQDVIFNMIFPRNKFSENEIQKLSKEINFNRVNLPKEGLQTGQFILIFKKYAEKNPEKLDGSARLCIWESLVEAYGWK